MNIASQTANKNDSHKNEGQLYRIFLDKIKIVDEFSGYVGAGPKESPYSSSEMASAIFEPYTPSPEQEPRHDVFIYGQAKNSGFSYRGFQFNGKKINFNGSEINIYSSLEKFPHSTVSIIDAVFLPKLTLNIYVENSLYEKIIYNLRTYKPHEVELLLEINLDSPQSPEYLCVKFKKAWFRSYFSLKKQLFNGFKTALIIAFGIFIYEEWIKYLVKNLEVFFLLLIIVFSMFLILFIFKYLKFQIKWKLYWKEIERKNT